jgi:Fur family ferric uptake transcriptional regulator
MCPRPRPKTKSDASRVAAGRHERPGEPASGIGEETMRLRDFLTRRGLRMTREREAILEAVLDSHDHFNVDLLFLRLQSRGHAVSRATIYRTLNLLVETGLVDRARFGSDSFSYEQMRGREHHDHMVCNACGEVIEFVSSEIERLQDAACEEHDFLPQSHRLTIFGLCSACIAKRPAREKRGA